MMYQNFQACADSVLPWRSLANIAAAGLSHRRPSFGIDRVIVGDRWVAVREVEMHATPFGTLLHFEKDPDAAQQAR
jgi:poly-beta-hydroxyalkanoate depolymerase